MTLSDSPASLDAQGGGQARGWLGALWAVPRGPWTRLAAGYSVLFLIAEILLGPTSELVLPRTAVGGAPAERSRPLRQAPRGQETIFIVEDETSLRTVARRVLEDRGYVVLEAGGADEAMTVLRGKGAPVDLLISDVVMSGGNGAELAVRARGLFPELPVLFISGYADTEMLRYGVDRTSAALLPKPFTPDELVVRVREVLDAAGRGAVATARPDPRSG